MPEFFAHLLRSDFMAHGYCYRWEADIVWLHAVSDAIITFSYYLIPLMLLSFVRQRRDVPFNWMFLMFGIFIFGCGTTHLMEVWTIWHGTYRLAGVFKAITAASSATTAALLIPLIPKAVALPSPAQLRAANLKLEDEITERRRVEAELQGAYDFVNTILDTVGALIIVTDNESRVVRFNRAAEAATGFQRLDVARKPILDLLPTAEERERMAAAFEQLRQGSEAAEFDTALRTKEGAPRLISWSTTLVTDAAGNVTNTIATGLDITEHRQLERAVLEISTREQRRIGQDLHDDLGQRLTGIAFMSRVLQDELAKASRPEAADAERVVRLVADAIQRTRDLSRGMAPVITESFGLMTALKGRANEISDTFQIDCRFECDPPVALRDPEVAHHLYNIVQEALNNAIRHGRAKVITVALTADGTTGRLTVTDDGSGFDANAASRGGLGRYTMENRGRIIGGALDVRSARGKGTVVSCVFPLPRK